MDASEGSKGKRPAPPTEVNDELNPSNLPEDALLVIAGYAAPPDVYNLALSSKRFHAREPPAAASTDGRRPARRSRSSSSGAADPRRTVLATRLLRQSLLVSLGRALDHAGTGITLDSALGMADLPPGSAIIAGSTMVQACLGVLWGEEGSTDVDVYSTCKAAPLVRSWLVDKAGCMFVGFKDYRIEMTDDRLLYTVDTKIHHVEHWGSLAENAKSKEEDEGGFCWGSNETQGMSEDEYYKTITKWGKSCQENYVDAKWNWGMSFDILGVDVDKSYNIKPRAGGDLPFDFDGDGSIDLIVARKGKEKQSKKKGKSAKKKAAPAEFTPFDILEDFDLTICKASFDGKTFRIPQPHLTFAGKTTMEPTRKAIVESYVKHFKHFRPPTSGYLEPIEQSRLASATIGAVRENLKQNSPIFCLVDFAASLPDHYSGEDFGPGSMYDRMVQAKHGPSIQFHNWTAKLVHRLRKYQERDVEVIGAPMVGADVRLPEFFLTS